MKYTGRIIGTTFTITAFLVARVYAYIYWDYPLTKPPVIAVVCLFFTWQLGRKYDKVKSHSERDSLTKLYNRRFVDGIFPVLIAQADRKNEKLSISILDCNEFKIVNDIYGHNRGDLVLQEISALLQATVRKSDIVARWGGDEFLVIAPCTDDKEMQTFICRLKSSLQDLSRKRQLDISASCGCAVYPCDATNLDDLLKLADYRMYQDKANNIKDTG